MTIAKNHYARVIPPHAHGGKLVKLFARFADGFMTCQIFESILKDKRQLIHIHESQLNFCSNLECLTFEGIEAIKEVCDFMRVPKDFFISS